ncbi:MAG: hypothetical protein NXI04_11490 [Planctomycetaceae bacterium]|nr:hypothetical protein [Planctomycetaceae bacterium]
MLFKRTAQAFLLGAGLSIVGTGCSAVDALVSSPAGHGASSTSPERLVAIARVFESQGHLQRANVMYRQALKADPGNEFVKERMQFIASVNSGRSFTPSTKTTTAVASTTPATPKATERDNMFEPAEIAPAPREQDTVLAAAEPNPFETGSEELTAALDNSSVMATLQPVESRIEPSPEIAVATTEFVPATRTDEVAEPLIQPTASSSDVAEELSVVDVGWDLAAADEPAQEELTTDIQIVPAPASENTAVVEAVVTETAETTVSTIAFAEEDNTAGRIEFASEWRATRPATVTLDEVADWMANPVENRDNLVRGLEHGEDTGVKALAATMLAECPVADEEINAALIAAFSNDSELLRLAAGDALIQRGAITDYCVDELIALLASSEAEIRIQAATSLRNCASSEWSARCVHGLARMLDQSNADVVVVAAATLGDFGADAQPYAAELEQLATGEDSRIAEASSNALKRINSSLNQGR